MRGAITYLVVAAAVVLLPAAAYAQATITGTVRDTSNAVMPGVTVEATSPAFAAMVTLPPGDVRHVSSW